MDQWYHKFDFLTLFLWAGLVAVGLVAIYSTTHGPAAEYLPESVQQNFYRQLVWAFICLGCITGALFFPVRFFQRAAYPVFAFTTLLVTLTIFIGKESGGAKAWLDLGAFQLQTAELAKVGTVLAVANLLASRKPNASNLRYALGAVALLVGPAILVLLQNDTGTALIFFGLVPVMLYWGGLPITTIMLMVSPAIAGYFSIVYMPAAIAFAIIFTLYVLWKTRERYMVVLAAAFTGGVAAVTSVALSQILQPHQIARIVSFTNPEAEEFRSGVGFHLVQSKAAIGSGGLTGKGFMEGTQTQGAYIPEQSTDFIFTVIAEEWGFVGAAILLALLAMLLIRLIVLGSRVKHPFGSMVAAGTVGVFLIHIFVNIGMVMGLLPVIGIPLPFVSYGGSAMLANTAMVAVVLNLHMRRDDFSIYGY